MKVNWLNGIDSQGIKIDKLNALSKKLIEHIAELNLLISESSDMVKGRSTTLSLLRSFFLFNIKYCLRESRRELRSISSKPYIYGIDYTLDEQNDSERRLYLLDSLVKPQGLVICLSAEPADYHSVTHVSANCYQYIGYRPTEMVGTDWSNYSPRPIR